jgi:uncharacterized zinc-type alcohol dehydrogenase-like protein
MASLHLRSPRYGRIDDGMVQGFGRKSLAGSMIGGIAETQEVID